MKQKSISKIELSKFITLVNTQGPATISHRLGEWDTQTIKRWIKTSNIPPHKTEKVRELLRGENK